MSERRYDSPSSFDVEQQPAASERICDVEIEKGQKTDLTDFSLVFWLQIIIIIVIHFNSFVPPTGEFIQQQQKYSMISQRNEKRKGLAEIPFQLTVELLRHLLVIIIIRILLR